MSPLYSEDSARLKNMRLKILEAFEDRRLIDKIKDIMQELQLWQKKKNVYYVAAKIIDWWDVQGIWQKIVVATRINEFLLFLFRPGSLVEIQTTLAFFF